MTRFAFVVGQDGPETLGRLKRLRFAASDARRFIERIKRKDLNFLVFPRGRGKAGEVKQHLIAGNQAGCYVVELS